MYNLKFSSLLLVGDIEEKYFFEKYFKKVELVYSNKEALKVFNKNIFSVIFLSCDTLDDDVFEICWKIRKSNHNIALALLTNSIDIDKLKKALPLHLSGCIERPVKKESVEEVLKFVDRELDFIYKNVIHLKNGYYFNKDKKILYNNLYNEVKLTKNELRLLIILIKSKDRFIAGEQIEHELWEDDSLEVDCVNRLKNLIYHLRKKLPKDSIINNYRLGYKLSCF